MTKLRESVRELPPGATVCGWCHAYEDRALRAEEEAEQRYKDVLRALKEIAAVPNHAPYCGKWGQRCTKCLAEDALERLGLRKLNIPVRRRDSA